MKKRQLTPLALAVGLALISQVGLAKEQTGAVIKNNMSFTDTADTYTARDTYTETVQGVNPENRGIYTQSDSSKKSSRNIWSLAVVSVDQRY